MGVLGLADGVPKQELGNERNVVIRREASGMRSHAKRGNEVKKIL